MADNTQNPNASTQVPESPNSANVIVSDTTTQDYIQQMETRLNSLEEQTAECLKNIRDRANAHFDLLEKDRFEKHKEEELNKYRRTVTFYENLAVDYLRLKYSAQNRSSNMDEETRKSIDNYIKEILSHAAVAKKYYVKYTLLDKTQWSTSDRQPLVQGDEDEIVIAAKNLYDTILQKRYESTLTLEEKFAAGTAIDSAYDSDDHFDSPTNEQKKWKDFLDSTSNSSDDSEAANIKVDDEDDVSSYRIRRSSCTHQ